MRTKFLNNDEVTRSLGYIYERLDKLEKKSHTPFDFTLLIKILKFLLEAEYTRIQEIVYNRQRELLIAICKKWMKELDAL